MDGDVSRVSMAASRAEDRTPFDHKTAESGSFAGFRHSSGAVGFIASKIHGLAYDTGISCQVGLVFRRRAVSCVYAG